MVVWHDDSDIHPKIRIDPLTAPILAVILRLY